MTNELERLKTELEVCHSRSARTSKSRENENCQQLNIQEKNCKASDSDLISSTRYETSMSHAQAENYVYNGSQNHLLKMRENEMPPKVQNIIHLPCSEDRNAYIHTVNENAYQSVKIYSNSPVNSEQLNNNISNYTPENYHLDQGISSNMDFTPNTYSPNKMIATNSEQRIETTQCEKYSIKIDKSPGDNFIVNNKNITENIMMQNQRNSHDYNYQENYEISHSNSGYTPFPENNYQEHTFPEEYAQNMNEIYSKYELDVKNNQNKSRSNS